MLDDNGVLKIDPGSTRRWRAAGASVGPQGDTFQQAEPACMEDKPREEIPDKI